MYMDLLENVWKRSDVDANGALSLVEWTGIIKLLGIEDKLDVNGTYNYADNHSTPTGNVTKSDIVYMVLNYDPSPVGAFMAGLFGGVDMSSMEFSMDVPDEVKTAAGRSTITITIAGSLEDLYPLDRETIKKNIAKIAGVSTSAVVLLFLPASVSLKANIFYSSDAAKTSGDLALDTTLVQPTTASAGAALGGYDVVAVAPVVSTASLANNSVDMMMVAPFAAMLIILSCVACVLGKVMSKKSQRVGMLRVLKHQIMDWQLNHLNHHFARRCFLLVHGYGWRTKEH